jgi:SAM-dependent methyltransferase
VTAGTDFHRGLAALLFQVVNRDDAPDVAYYRGIIERSGQPALDAGCGPGRLLCQYLRAGLDVDGCDISPDMVDLCRRRAEAEGLAPSLHVQSTAGLDLPRRYRTIVSCGTFGLNGTRADDLESLRRFHHHLEPGGTLAVDIEAGWAMTEMWRRCASADRSQPGEWTTRDSTPLPDDDEIVVRRRLVEADPLGQSFTLDLRYELVRDGSVVRSEDHRLVERWYGVEEMIGMLETAGFADVRVEGDYSPVEVTADHRMHVFIARRP